MVKISFQQPGTGLKAEKDGAAGGGAKAEASLPQDVEVQPLPVQSRRSSFSRMCYLTMILMLLLLGLILTSMYVYRYFSITGSSSTYSENLFHCGVIYQDHSYSQLKEQMELHEDVRIYLEEDYEQINIPMPHFGESDPADIIHDFQRGLTAYHDIALDKCYVIELNTTIVMPPQSFWELLINVKKGVYLPQTYIIQEEMIVTEHVTDMDQLGSFIYHLCRGKETYRLKRRTSRRHIHRRAAESCHHIRHFENTFVVDTAICQKL
ncbi:integral membrane protein 2C [Sphaerodactylus townsendi]|uniref:integral membrane protein 2C n=1 Tax=Sphaerodactylus townsendi TaxID=933632 RepID=UPI00202728DF|nr:integral membrane protein 2C [Sphaerodactylus townsendi]